MQCGKGYIQNVERNSMQTIKLADIGVSADQTVAIVKRAMFLAYQACGGPLGMGVFQDRGAVTEEQVWKNVCTNGDYLFGAPAVDKTAEAPVDEDVDVYGITCSDACSRWA